MAVKIRLARGGSKKRPHYSIVVADERAPRDGRFLEKLGTYNPMLPRDDANRVVYKLDRVQHWLSVGAQPTDRVSRFLEKANLVPAKTRNNPQKAVIGKKMADRAEANAAKLAAGSAETEAA
jgi:small subunit ribosomal protein S16